MSHSKRNTSRAVFTSHERDLAKKAWGVNSARLTRESYLSFSSCVLCLEIARDPVSCTHGDIFCRECALSNILAQKKEIKRLDKIRENDNKDAQEQKERKDTEDRERAIREFEATQNGLDVRISTSETKRNIDWRGSHKPLEEQSTAPKLITEGDDANQTLEASGTTRPGKRKFELDESELQRISNEDRAKARKAIDTENNKAPKLPSFWTPSITPSSNTHDTLHTITKKQKTVPICPASQEDAPHAYSLHSLVTLNFSEELDEKTKKPVRICPSCKKGLSNSSKAVLAKPCGHVLCKNCVEQFVKPSKHNDHHHHDPHAISPGGGGGGGEDAPPLVLCYVCDADLTDRGDDLAPATTTNGEGGKKGKKDNKKKDKEQIRPGLVDLRCDGTGFSAGGANQVKKSGVQFQC